MFGKLFGRSRKTVVLDSGLPAVSSTPGTAPAVTVTTTTTTQPLEWNGTANGVDLSTLMSTVKEARDHAHGDPMAMVTELQQKLGGGTAFAVPWTGMGGTDTVSQLERLAKLHTEGALTDAEFAAEKAKLIGTPPPPAA